MDQKESGGELRNDLEEMLFDGTGIRQSNFFAAIRGPGASGDRGKAGGLQFQYQSYGERGGWTDYAYSDDEFVPVSGEEENYVVDEGADLSAGSESDESNEVDYGDVTDRRINVEGGRRGTYSSFERLSTTAMPPLTYNTTVKYKTTVNDSFNYIGLESNHKATSITKTTTTTTTTTTHTTSSTTVRYIENGKGVHWPRVPTSSLIDEEVTEGTTRTIAADVAAEERYGADYDEGSTKHPTDISPKTTPSSSNPKSTSTVNFHVPEIRVTYVPPDKREVDINVAKETTERVLTGGVLFGGENSGSAAENSAVRFSYLSTSSSLIFLLFLIFLQVEYVLNNFTMHYS